jgi:biotin transporter BioY
LGWSRALAAGLWPFLPGEIFKMLLIVVAVRGVELARARK